MAAAKKTQDTQSAFVIKAPNTECLAIQIVGTSPLVSNRFPHAGQVKLEGDMTLTPEQRRKQQQEVKKNGRPPKNFQAEYEGSMHIDVKTGHPGMNAMAFKNAMVRACKPVGIPMVDAKLFITVVPDGYNSEGQAIYHFTKGKPRLVKHHVNNANGSVDVRARAMFDAGWEMTITVRYNKDLIDAASVVNLVQQAGENVGVGAGRQFSSNSCGMGWGSFTVKEDKELKKKLQKSAA